MSAFVPKISWLVTVLLLSAYILSHCIHHLKTIGSTSHILDLSVTVLIVCVSGALLGTVSALLPYKQKRFVQKFKVTLPFFISAVLLVQTTLYTYLLYTKHVKGVILKPLHTYEAIQIPVKSDCSSIHHGKFETEKSIIERWGNTQTQVDKKTGQKKVFIVEWINNCEYSLTPVDDNSKKLKIKITKVNSDDYGCYIIQENSENLYPVFLTVKRIRKHN